MSKPWGGIGIGTWADEAERADEEHAAEATAATAAADTQSFPSLKEAASNAKSKKKKKMTLPEFTKGTYTAPGGRSSIGLTQQEILQLPTGPRQRSEEEMQPGRLGGGFSSYGGDRSGGRMGRDRNDSDGSWGGGGGGRRPYGGGFDDDRRGNQSRVSDFPQPSRADEVDDWGKDKKSIPSFDQGRQGGRYGGLGGGGGGGGSFGGGGGSSYGGGGSRADDVDNWGAGKRQAPGRSSTFGSSFGDSGRESDRWSRGNVVEGSGVQEERRRLVLEPRKVESGGSETLPGAVKTSKPSPFGAARPREEVLAEKGLDWKKIDSEIEAKKGGSQTSRPTSAHSSRPSSAQSNRSESLGLNNAVKPRPKVNPFGDAKPREVLLEEQGKDWRKMDMELEHRRVDRPETEGENMLKEEIEELRKKLEKESIAPENKESEQESGSNNNHHDLPETIHAKEKDLELLTRELDDKVRFRQKPIERPGSGAGRTGSFSERTHSQAGSIDDTRSFESTERPRSRGAVDAWVRPVDDQRRNFQGSKERGFFSNRSSSPREGW
ncbi:Eukaryotic translation initiation factor 4B1 [Cardamine amara subsp. amara]|uniref:Eukaryotic translation initiation factor 4B1 n=1 Tax=Cardamine amara subsp. amara TaxID=228776 RepID=A0ABD1A2P2_CARAN